MTKILTRIGTKGQAVIPKPVRDELGLKPGDAVYVYTHEGHAHLEKPPAAASWEDFFKAVPKRRLPKNYDWDKDIEEEMYGD